MNQLWTGIFLSLGLSAFLPACASSQAQRPHWIGQPVVPAGTASARQDTSNLVPKPDASVPASGTVQIDPRIVAACGHLPEPHFDFDSASIRGPAADHLRVVASCFTTGPLRGRRVKLVGRADPRGAPAYNLALGENRATSVARFLQDAGIPRAQITTMSRGAFDATGTDEQSWARDRRVDLVLGE
jgi:peptidoglycan-associated lipoprotein